MMLPIVLASALAVTNAPSSFSTTVERTFTCPAITETTVGRRYHLYLPPSGACRVELAVGRDANGDGKLADEESPFAVTCSRHALEVRNRQGVSVFESQFSGSSALQAGVEMQRLRDAFTFIIR